MRIQQQQQQQHNRFSAAKQHLVISSIISILWHVSQTLSFVNIERTVHCVMNNCTSQYSQRTFSNPKKLVSLNCFFWIQQVVENGRSCFELNVNGESVLGTVRLQEIAIGGTVQELVVSIVDNGLLPGWFQSSDPLFPIVISVEMTLQSQSPTSDVTWSVLEKLGCEERTNNWLSMISPRFEFCQNLYSHKNKQSFFKSNEHKNGTSKMDLHYWNILLLSPLPLNHFRQCPRQTTYVYVSVLIWTSTRESNFNVWILNFSVCVHCNNRKRRGSWLQWNVPSRRL